VSSGFTADSPRWFNISAPYVAVQWRRRHFFSFKLFSTFNKVSTEGHFWGVGLLQINRRHLFWLGDQGRGVRLLAFFLGQTE
jgi:hypothetical protein